MLLSRYIRYISVDLISKISGVVVNNYLRERSRRSRRTSEGGEEDGECEARAQNFFFLDVRIGVREL